MILESITAVGTILIGATTFSLLSSKIKKKKPLLESFNHNTFALINWFIFIPLFNTVAAYKGIFNIINIERVLISLMLAAILIIIIFILRREISSRNNWVRPKKGTTTKAGNYFFFIRFLETTTIIYVLIGGWFMPIIWYPLLAIGTTLLAQIANFNKIK